MNQQLWFSRLVAPGLVMLSIAFGGFESLAFAQNDDNRVMTGVRFDGNTSIISYVIDGGPANAAGIKVGDEILSADNSFVVQPLDLLMALKDKSSGDMVRLEVRRGSTIQFFDLALINAVNGERVVVKDGKPVVMQAKVGLVGEIAPEIKLDNWHGLASGEPARLKNLRGKVVCLLIFQTDCDISCRFGIPQVKEIHDNFIDDPDVAVLALHTPFRNYDVNTLENAIALFESMGCRIPVAHEGDPKRRSKTYDSLKAPGTPWILVLDKQGIVRFNDVRLPLDKAKELFAKLKEAEVEGDEAVENEDQ